MDLPSITSAQLHQLSQLFVGAEVLNAIKTLHHNESPGADGYTIEFYK